MKTTIGFSTLALALIIGCGDETSPSTTAATGPGGSGGTMMADGGGGSMAGPGGGGAGGSGAAGGAGGTGGGPACATLSDELDDAATLSCWSLLHEVDGRPAYHELLDLGTEVAGHLVIDPYASGWFEDDRGPFVFKEVTGDFVVEVHAAAVDETNPAMPPTGDYHSAGLLVRDPASVAGDENWIMYNTGHQNAQGATTGTEGKTTVDSVSVLTINQGDHAGLLRICRIGNDYRLLKRLDDENVWTEEHLFTRADLPATLQLGFVTNAWPPGPTTDPRNMRGRFGHIHVGVPTQVADCTAAITQLF